jgi:hypothetical protein
MITALFIPLAGVTAFLICYGTTGSANRALLSGLLSAFATAFTLRLLAKRRHGRLIRAEATLAGLSVRRLRSPFGVFYGAHPRRPLWEEHAFYDLIAVTAAGEEKHFPVIVDGIFACLLVTRIALLLARPRRRPTAG